MLTLAIDRATSRPGVALFDGERLLLARSLEGSQPRAPHWVSAAGELLREAGLSPARLGRLVVGTGPGSFSGIRSAIAAAQGLALPFDTPLFGVSSAAALARRVLLDRDAACVAVAGDARRRRLWCTAFRLSDDGRLLLAATGRPPSHGGDDFALVEQDGLAAALPAGALLVSPDWERLATGLAGLAGSVPRVEQPLEATAEDVGALLLADPGAAPRDPVPVYLHPAVA